MTGNLKMFAQNSTFAKSSFPGSGQLNTVGFNEMKGKPVEFGCQSFGRMVVVPSLVLTGAVRYLGAGTNSRGLDRLGESDRSPFTPKHASRPGGSDVFPRREA